MKCGAVTNLNCCKYYEHPDKCIHLSTNPSHCEWAVLESNVGGSLGSGVDCKPDWKSAENKPEGETVVLIYVHSLGEFGICSAWWCAEDYKWIALDDAVQFEEGEVEAWCKQIKFPTGI